MGSRIIPTVTKRYLFWSGFDALLSWIFGMVMLLAAVPHLENPYYFLGSVYAYKLVAPGIGQLTAIILPLVQLTIAVLLIGRVFIDASNLITMILFGIFVTVQSFAYFGGLDISCGCFGPGHDSPIGWFSLSLVYSLFILSVLRNAICFLPFPKKTAKCVQVR